MIIGFNNLTRIFDEKYYNNLNGGILESFSRLFGSNVKLYVYPALDPKTKEIMTCDTFEPAPHLTYLFKHFVTNRQIEDVDKAKTENLHIISDQVLDMIKDGEEGWEDMVPNRVADAIKSNHLFSYPYELKMDEEDLIPD